MKEGRVIVENTLPEVSAAERNVTDAVHSGHIAVKETVEAQVKD